MSSLFFLICFTYSQLVQASYFPTNESLFDLSNPKNIQGEFTYVNKGLILSNDNERRASSYFIPTVGRYANGVLRSVVTLGSQPNMSVNFRCQNIEDRMPCSSTHRIKIASDDIHFQTLANGKLVKDIPIEVSLTKIKQVEVVISSFRMHHHVFVYDTEVNKLIGSLYVEDSELDSGVVSIEAESSQSPDTIVHLFGLNLSEPYVEKIADLKQSRPISLRSPTESRGEWDVEQGLVFTKHDPNSRYNIWATDTEDYSDGVLTTDISLGSKPDISILFRYDQTSIENPSGYSLSIEGKSLVVYRWDNGRPRVMKKLSKIPKQTTAVRVIILSNKHTHSVVILDSETQVVIDNYLFTDSRWLQGGVSFRANQKQMIDTVITKASLLKSSYKQTGTEDIFDIFGQEGRAIVNNISKKDLHSIPSLAWIQTTERGEHVVFTDRDVPKVILNRGGSFVELHWKIPYTFKNLEYIQAQQEIAANTFNILETTSYKTPEMVAEYLTVLHEKYPKISKLEVLTHTRNNRPIYALRITDNPTIDESEPMILLNGAHHGSELMTTEFALDAARFLLEGYSTVEGRKRVNNFDFWVIPLVNPDGNYNLWNVDHNIGRKNYWDVNGNGVMEYNEGTDLNRNYPFAWNTLGERGSSSSIYHSWYRGDKPASEPETQAMMKLANKYHPVVVFSWHTSGNMLLSPYTIDNIKIPDPDIPWMIAEEVLKDLEKAPDKPTAMRLRRNMYSVDGTDQDWHYYQNGSIAYIIEGPFHNPRPPLMQDATQYLRVILDRMIQYVETAPRIYGKILDEAGGGVEATITIQELQTFMNEDWRTRDFDGRYDRFTGENGKYTVTVSASGFQTRSQVITVNGPTQLNLTLKRVDP